MAGILLKAHEGSTVEAAAALEVMHGPLRVADGVVLNRYVGGVNPDAVQASVRLGGRCVWFPTIDSDDHVRVYGSTGAYYQQSGGIQDTPAISALDTDGALTAPAREVLAIARDHGVCVATGHLSARAIDRVLDASRDLGLERVLVLVQHPCFATPHLDLDAIEAVAARSGCVELTYLSVSPMWSDVTLDRCVEVMRRVAPGAIVVTSDARQPHNPAPPEALRSFAQSLHERGASAAGLRRALGETPARLLGW
jgi:hypothetical protein